MVNPYIVGKKLYLRHPTAEDAQGKWHEWLSDESITKYMSERFWPNSVENQLDFHKSISESSKRLALSIVTIEDDKLIGTCSLGSINWVHKCAEASIIIGDKEYHKGAISFEAMHLLLKVAFARLNFENIIASYMQDNEGIAVIMQALGFEEVGRLRAIYEVDCKKQDDVILQLSRAAWIKKNIKA